MQFDTLVNNILKESIIGAEMPSEDVPVLDGRREVYIVPIFYNKLTGVYIDHYASRVVRETPSALKYCWDSDGLDKNFQIKNYQIICETNNFNKACNELIIYGEKCIKTKHHANSLMSAIHQAIDTFQPFKDITGTFKVVHHLWSISLGVEVDTDAYKQSSHAAEDLLGF